jgi:hypothetical protein
MLMDRVNEQAALTADNFLTLIERHLFELWGAHAHSGNRSLRVVLRSAETLLAERAGWIWQSFGARVAIAAASTV